MLDAAAATRLPSSKSYIKGQRSQGQIDMHKHIYTSIFHIPKAPSPQKLHTDVDAHRRWAILQNILYFTVFEVARKWLTNGWLTIMDAQGHPHRLLDHPQ